VVLDILAKKLVRLDGELIADDFNFIKDQYNRYRVLARTIEELDIPDDTRKQLKEKYADHILRNSRPMDVHEEKEVLLTKYGKE
jgi:hypothetical protein